MMRVALPLLSLGAVAASCLASAASNLPPLRAQRWVNSPPLTARGLRGKVVLVDFWEYTCVNWIRTAPLRQSLASRLQTARLGRHRCARTGVRVRQGHRQY